MRHNMLMPLCGIAALGIVGCATQTPEIAAVDTTSMAMAHPLGNVELHTSLLASELFADLNADKPYRYAVVGFVPVTSLAFDADQQHPLMLLGHQLEQGLITEAVKRGFVAQDFKVTNDIFVEKDADRVFSRNVAELASAQNIDFFISGTLTEQQEGVIVNARVIQTKSKDVVAAATKFFPAELFWQREKVTTRHGKLYRTGS